MLFTPRNQCGTAPWSTVQDVTFTNNKIYNTAGAMNLLTTDDIHTTNTPLERIAILNNLFLNSQQITISNGAQPAQDITINNNLFIDNRGTTVGGSLDFSSPTATPAVTGLTCRITFGCMAITV